MTKLCSECKCEFTPKYNSTQPVCDVSCAIARAARLKAAKAKKKRIADKKQFNRARRDWKEADRPKQNELCQAAINWYVKYVKEADKPCYTCGKPLGPNDKQDAGHWKTVGGHPEKRFDIEFIKKQCFSCNHKRSGMPDEFEKRLRAEYGDEKVDAFVASKPPKMTTPEIVELKKHYLKLNREARKEMGL